MNNKPAFKAVDYVNEDGSTNVAIELLDCYPGVIFTYDDIKFVEVPNEEHGMLEFSYFIKEGSVPDDEFKLVEKVIGDVLLSIIEDGLSTPSLEERY